MAFYNSTHKFIFGLLAVALVALFSCSDDTFEINPNFANSNSEAILSNETPLELSTYRLDSVQTSGNHMVWVGVCRKPYIGRIHSESYIRLTEPRRDGKTSYGWLGTRYVESGKDSLWNGIASKEVYDSVTMVLRHTGAYEGDTMQPINVVVKRLAQRLRFSENERVFSNLRYFRDSTEIGHFTFRPCPHSHPRVRFRLDDEFGIDLVKFIMSAKQYETAVQSQRFDNFLGGIKVTCSDTLSSGRVSPPQSLLCFLADSLQIVLHSHIRGMESLKQERVLAMRNPELQFNHVSNDDVDEDFAGIAHRYEQVTESEAHLHSVLFEGLGYYTRINIPDLRYLQAQMNDGHYVRATLKLYPERGSYDHRRIPSRFYLSAVNRGNVIQGPLSDASGRSVVANLVYNPYDLNMIYYEADLTFYLNSILSAGEMDERVGVALSWGSSSDPTNYEFMVFNGHGKRQYRSVLELYYYKYDRVNY